MTKISVSFWAFLLLLITACTPEARTPIVADIPFSVAHRGAHIDGLIPENAPSGVEMAARMGFRAIECDVHYTQDSVMILMHDATINRTMRLRDGYKEIPEQVRYSDLSYAELRDKYILASDEEQYRQPIPTFDEELEALKKYGIIPMMHTDLPEAFQRAHEVLGDGFIAFTTNYDALVEARKISSGCMILWDPGWTGAEETIEKLRALGGRCGISSMKMDLLTKEYVGKIRQAGYDVQSSIFPAPHDMDAAENGCSIILSDFSLFPAMDDAIRKDSPVKTFSDLDLKAGEKLVLDSWEEAELFSVEAQILSSGDVSLMVGGTEYPVRGDSIGRIVGRRFHKCASQVEIIAHSNAHVNRVSVQKFDY